MRNEIAYFRQKAMMAPPVHQGKFMPFRIRFFMGSPVCVTHPWIHLDSLIAHLMLLDALGEDFFITPKKLDLSEHLPKNGRLLPLKKTGNVYHASVSQFIPNNLRTTKIYKRFEERWTDGLGKKKIRIGQGHFRAYMMYEPYVPAREVIFYANGDMALIRDLVGKYLCGLGNDIRIGFGMIRDVEFELVEEDWSLVADGVAMRPIPVEMCSEHDDVAYLAYKAPYWNPKNVTLCVPPGARCRLKDGHEGNLVQVGGN